MVVAIVIIALIALVGIPLSYVLGRSVGYASGYNEGWSVGYAERLEDGRFSFYYVKLSERKYGVNDLSKELERLEWIKPYQEGVFDCSEMSAYLEWHLENEGWHTMIIVGNSPSGSGRHSWLLVETSSDKYMPVEPTTIEVVWWSSSNFDNYFQYDHTFETIEEALAYSETGFDWWKS